MDKGFVKKLIESRTKLKLKVPELASLVGLSAKYIYNIEKEASPDKVDSKHSKKNISLEKLRNIILALSLKGISKDTRKFIDRKSENKKMYFETQKELPKVEDLDLETLKDLVFSSVGLQGYYGSFRQQQKVYTSGTEINEFVEENLKDKSIDTFRHDYQVWTFSDILSDGFADGHSANKTAFNILNYKIKYVSFIPIDDDTQARMAYNNVKQAIEKTLKVASKDIQKHWRKEKWQSYLTYYGLSAGAFLCRLRLYNPTGMVSGNYNVGGTFSDSMKLISIEPGTAVEMRNKLRMTMEEIESQKSKEPILLGKLGCYGIKKNFS